MDLEVQKFISSSRSLTSLYCEPKKKTRNSVFVRNLDKP